MRPPPSLLRGLQAPPGSLSPLGGAANFPAVEISVRGVPKIVQRDDILRLRRGGKFSSERLGGFNQLLQPRALLQCLRTVAQLALGPVGHDRKVISDEHIQQTPAV